MIVSTPHPPPQHQRINCISLLSPPHLTLTDTAAFLSLIPPLYQMHMTIMRSAVKRQRVRDLSKRSALGRPWVVSISVVCLYSPSGTFPHPSPRVETSEQSVNLIQYLRNEWPTTTASSLLTPPVRIAIYPVMRKREQSRSHKCFTLTLSLCKDLPFLWEKKRTF